MGSAFVRQAIGKASLPVAFISCALMSVALLVGYYGAWKFGNDFGVYWRTANNPVELAYSPGWLYPFPYAPTMLLWVSPLSLVPKWPAFFAFIICSAAAFVFACRPYLPKAAIALILITSPFLRGMFTGQVCAILAALMLWACGSKNRIAAGIAFGVIASIKPQLVLMAPLMLALNRDWRAFESSV